MVNPSSTMPLPQPARQVTGERNRCRQHGRGNPRYRLRIRAVPLWNLEPGGTLHDAISATMTHCNGKSTTPYAVYSIVIN